MEGNPVCLQVPWDSNQEFIQAWTEVCIYTPSQTEGTSWNCATDGSKPELRPKEMTFYSLF